MTKPKNLLKSKVYQITQIFRNLAVRHNLYFQIIGSFLIVGFLIYLHFMQPPSTDLGTILLLDKLIHCLMFFFVMMWFMYITKRWLIVAISLMLLGLMLEWIQMSYITNRSFEWFDWIADGIGIVLCFLLLPVLVDKSSDSAV